MQMHPAQYRSSLGKQFRHHQGARPTSRQALPSRCLGREAHPLVVEMLAKLAELEESKEYCEVLVAVSSSSPELETGGHHPRDFLFAPPCRKLNVSSYTPFLTTP